MTTKKAMCVLVVAAGCGGSDARDVEAVDAAPDSARAPDMGAAAGVDAGVATTADAGSVADGGTVDAKTAPDSAGAGDASAARDTAADAAVEGDPEAQTPPQGRAALTAWIAKGHYKAWACEPEVVSGRAGAHGRNRICSNALLSANRGGPYPVGAASVKELYDGSKKITGYAVARKVTVGTTGGNWYWYEGVGSSTSADAVNAGACTGCHGQAQQKGGNDFVYVQVK